MKIIILILFLTLQSHAKKTLYIYNFSSQVIQDWDIATRPGTSFFPEFHSKQYGIITITPGGDLTLVNTSNIYRFPFYSPTSSTVINIWEQLNSNGTSPEFSDIDAWPLGDDQVFWYTKLLIGSNYLENIGTDTPFVTDGATWEAIYQLYTPVPSNPNLIEYVVTIYDN